MLELMKGMEENNTEASRRINRNRIEIIKESRLA